MYKINDDEAYLIPFLIKYIEDPKGKSKNEFFLKLMTANKVSAQSVKNTILYIIELYEKRSKALQSLLYLDVKKVNDEDLI